MKNVNLLHASEIRRNSNVLSLNSINQMDAIKGLKQLDDECCDILLIDPPYNIGKDFGNTTDKMSMKDYLDWCNGWLSESIRVLKPTGTIFVFGFSEILAHLSVNIPLNKRWLIWHYTNKNVPKLTFWQRSHEAIVCAWKHTQIFNTDDVREPYTEPFLKSNGKTRKPTKGRFSKGYQETLYAAHERGALPRDVIKVPALAGGAGAVERYFICHTCHDVYSPRYLKKHGEHNIEKHPTQKPLALIDRLIKSAKPEEKGLLVSLFSGSGTDCIAAINNKMDYIGFELNPNYINISERRIADVRSTMKEVNAAESSMTEERRLAEKKKLQQTY